MLARWIDDGAEDRFRRVADFDTGRHDQLMAHDWLTDIVVVNENASEPAAGDVSIFRSEGDACQWLEHWWVESGEGFAFTAVGDRVLLEVESNRRVRAAGREPTAGGKEIVLQWLRARAASVLAARRAKAARGSAALAPFEERGELPASVEGLIAYVGFDG